MTEEKQPIKLITKAPGYELYAVDGYRNRDVKVMAHRTEAPTSEGELAMRLVERWGMIMATPDGEDSSGRQKIRAQTPDELVDRALAVSKTLFERMRSSGNVIAIPSLQEIEKSFDGEST